MESIRAAPRKRSGRAIGGSHRIGAHLLRRLCPAGLFALHRLPTWRLVGDAGQFQDADPLCWSHRLRRAPGRPVLRFVHPGHGARSPSSGRSRQGRRPSAPKGAGQHGIGRRRHPQGPFAHPLPTPQEVRRERGGDRQAGNPLPGGESVPYSRARQRLDVRCGRWRVRPCGSRSRGVRDPARGTSASGVRRRARATRQAADQDLGCCSDTIDRVWQWQEDIIRFCCGTPPIRGCPGG